ncbi:MAG: Holliday junction resolvase-like protein [Candidatus Korarchaeum sp.]
MIEEGIIRRGRILKGYRALDPLPGFPSFNSKGLRLSGSPADLIAFDGSGEVDQGGSVEAKAGNSGNLLERKRIARLCVGSRSANIR